MTDEQNPTGEQPQDPAQPTPYGQPPTTPPPPPVNPYDQQPAAPDPAAPDPVAPPAYGQPQPPAYGQPQYGAPQYGSTQYDPPTAATPGPPPGAYPGVPVETEAGKGMAITALVLSLLCCFPIGLILAIIVLVRSKDGRNHGKGLAIGAVVVSFVSVIALSVGAYALTQVDWDDLLPVEQLQTGDCLNASNLADDEPAFVEHIKEVSCDEPHDAEVLVTKELTQDDAASYEPSSSPLCTDLITEGGLADKVAGADMGYFGLTTDADPNAGDKLVCVAYKLDGSKLAAPL